MNKVDLVAQVNNAIALAEQRQSKLSAEILAMSGMSSDKIRHFLNNICSNPNQRYLEIGVWKGSTFVSANYQNEHTHPSIAIDDFSEFNDIDVLNEFNENTQKHLQPSQYDFIQEQCFQVNLDRFNTKFQIYFYDGCHTEQAQYLALTHFQSVLDDEIILIIDDWNFKEVPNGTRKAIQDLNWSMIHEWIMPAEIIGDVNNWWNGLFIAVVNKS